MYLLTFNSGHFLWSVKNYLEDHTPKLPWRLHTQTPPNTNLNAGIKNSSCMWQNSEILITCTSCMENVMYINHAHVYMYIFFILQWRLKHSMAAYFVIYKYRVTVWTFHQTCYKNLTFVLFGRHQGVLPQHSRLRLPSRRK